MNFAVPFRYAHASSLAGGMLNFAPNLAREPVAFDAALRHPLLFREAISSLHDVVVSDLRFKPKDKTAYEEWKQREKERESALRKGTYEEAKQTILAGQSADVPRDLTKQYNQAKKQYWGARQAYANHLLKTDRELWRMLLPCDPVVTVAEDAVLFECFSADESSYGCLSVDRDQHFSASQATQLGTTNVDYSWDLYHSFQGLRSYRETRFRLDPAGLDVATAGQEMYREEKIDLPAGWLRGLMQVQSAMTLPMKHVTLPRDAVYSLLAFLRRHKARESPRALRFDLGGPAPALVLEPWEQRIPVYQPAGFHPGEPPIRIWGKNRLLSLARLLPLAERIDVHLLGTGLPSFWVVKLPGMTLTLGLSGWTSNDWTRGSSLDLLAPPVEPDAATVTRVSSQLAACRRATFAEIEHHAGGGSPGLTAAALKHLAHTGQLIYDLPAGVFRWRQIMHMALGESEMGPPNAEATAVGALVTGDKVKISSRQEAPSGGVVFTATVDHKPVEILLDPDGGIRKGRCPCGHHQKAGLRMGPCRHLLALRQCAQMGGSPSSAGNADSWYQGLQARAI